MEAEEQFFVSMNLFEKNVTCAICMDFMKNPTASKCGHPFCDACIGNIFKRRKENQKCPLCMAPVTRRNFRKRDQVQKILDCFAEIIEAMKKDQVEVDFSSFDAAMLLNNVVKEPIQKQKKIQVFEDSVKPGKKMPAKLHENIGFPKIVNIKQGKRDYSRKVLDESQFLSVSQRGEQVYDFDMLREVTKIDLGDSPKVAEKVSDWLNRFDGKAASPPSIVGDLKIPASETKEKKFFKSERNHKFKVDTSTTPPRSRSKSTPARRPKYMGFSAEKVKVADPYSFIPSQSEPKKKKGRPRGKKKPEKSPSPDFLDDFDRLFSEDLNKNVTEKKKEIVESPDEILAPKSPDVVLFESQPTQIVHEPPETGTKQSTKKNVGTKKVEKRVTRSRGKEKVEDMVDDDLNISTLFAEEERVVIEDDSIPTTSSMGVIPVEKVEKPVIQDVSRKSLNGKLVKNLGKFKPPPLVPSEKEESLVSVLKGHGTEKDGLKKKVMFQQPTEIALYDVQSSNDSSELSQRIQQSTPAGKVASPKASVSPGWSRVEGLKEEFEKKSRTLDVTTRSNVKPEVAKEIEYICSSFEEAVPLTAPPPRPPRPPPLFRSPKRPSGSVSPRVVPLQLGNEPEVITVQDASAQPRRATFSMDAETQDLSAVASKESTQDLFRESMQRRSTETVVPQMSNQFASPVKKIRIIPKESPASSFPLHGSEGVSTAPTEVLMSEINGYVQKEDAPRLSRGVQLVAPLSSSDEETSKVKESRSVEIQVTQSLFREDNEKLTSSVEKPKRVTVPFFKASVIKTPPKTRYARFSVPFLVSGRLGPKLSPQHFQDSEQLAPVRIPGAEILPERTLIEEGPVTAVERYEVEQMPNGVSSDAQVNEAARKDEEDVTDLDELNQTAEKVFEDLLDLDRPVDVSSKVETTSEKIPDGNTSDADKTARIASRKEQVEMVEEALEALFSDQPKDTGKVDLKSREVKNTEKVDFKSREVKDTEKLDLSSKEVKDAENVDLRSKEVKHTEKVYLRSKEVKDMEKVDLRSKEVKDTEKVDLRSKEVKDTEKVDLRSNEVRDTGKVALKSREVGSPAQLVTPKKQNSQDVPFRVLRSPKFKDSTPVSASTPKTSLAENKRLSGNTKLSRSSVSTASNNKSRFADENDESESIDLVSLSDSPQQEIAGSALIGDDENTADVGRRGSKQKRKLTKGSLVERAIAGEFSPEPRAENSKNGSAGPAKESVGIQSPSTKRTRSPSPSQSPVREPHSTSIMDKIMKGNEDIFSDEATQESSHAVSLSSDSDEENKYKRRKTERQSKETIRLKFKPKKKKNSFVHNSNISLDEVIDIDDAKLDDIPVIALDEGDQQAEDPVAVSPLAVTKSQKVPETPPEKLGSRLPFSPLKNLENVRGNPLKTPENSKIAPLSNKKSAKRILASYHKPEVEDIFGAENSRIDEILLPVIVKENLGTSPRLALKERSFALKQGLERTVSPSKQISSPASKTVEESKLARVNTDSTFGIDITGISKIGDRKLSTGTHLSMVPTYPKVDDEVTDGTQSSLTSVPSYILDKDFYAGGTQSSEAQPQSRKRSSPEPVAEKDKRLRMENGETQDSFDMEAANIPDAMLTKLPPTEAIDDQIRKMEELLETLRKKKQEEELNSSHQGAAAESEDILGCSQENTVTRAQNIVSSTKRLSSGSKSPVERVSSPRQMLSSVPAVEATKDSPVMKKPVKIDSPVSRRLSGAAPASVPLSPRRALTYTGLSSKEKLLVKQFCDEFGFEDLPVYSSEVTHVITKMDGDGRCKRTLKYLQGVAGRKWVLLFEWISECLKAKRLLPEEPFEPSEQGDGYITRRARTVGSNIFEGYTFCIVGPLKLVSNQQLKELMLACGARVVNSLSMLESFGERQAIILEPTETQQYLDIMKEWSDKGVISLSHEWITDCVGALQIQPIGYCILDFPELGVELLQRTGWPAHVIQELVNFMETQDEIHE